MGKQSTRIRYLLTCLDSKSLQRLKTILRRLKSGPPLVSSKNFKKASAQNIAIVNEGICVASAPLTYNELREIKKAEICRVEKDVFAFNCISEFESLNTAISEYPLPWGIKKIDSDIIWEKTKGKGIKIAVLDTGVDPHPNLKNNLKNGISFVENVNNTKDDNGHGTHCAGIIAAHGPDIYGVAPEANIYPIKVLNYNGKGHVSGILAGLEWCLQKKIDVVSMSLQIQSDNPPGVALKQACEKLWNEGMVLIAAVGNDHQEKRAKKLSVGYPARYNCVIGVGATDPKDTIAPFSNIGTGVDLVAPGVDILSTYRDRYRILSGTSQACPHVAGVAGLLKSYRNDLKNENIKKIILETADPLGSESPDNIYGHGLLNASAAIEQWDHFVD